MKLKDLKEWGGRDLPGFGDEATWGGRTPDGDDESTGSIEEFVKSNYVRTDELEDAAMFLPIGWLHLDDDEKTILGNLKEHGITVKNDTGHDFATAFNHIIKPMWNLMCGPGEDTYFDHQSAAALKEFSASVPKELSMTELQAAVKKWMGIAKQGAHSMADIQAAFEG